MAGVKAHLRSRFPGLAVGYKRTLRPLVKRKEPTARLDKWVSDGEALLARQGIEAITVTGDNAWLREPDAFEWLYLEGRSSLLSLKDGRRHEPAELELLADRLSAGGTLLDVGANIGYVSVRLARRIPELRIVAIEPVPSAYEALRANIDRNGVGDRVTAINAAATERPGSIHVTVDKGPANHLLSSGVPGTAEVAGMRLSDAVPDVPITAIKIDVEGAELPALRGAEPILRRDHPPVLLEAEERWTTRFGYQPGELFDWLAGMDYRRHMVLPGGLEVSTTATDVERTNAFWFD